MVLATIDLIDSGLMGFVARLQSARHHAALLTLSLHIASPSEFTVADAVFMLPVVRDIRTLPTRTLLAKHAKPVSHGLLRVLQKVQVSSGWRAKTYLALAQIFSDADHCRAANALRHMSKITAGHIRVVHILRREPTFITPGWVQGLSTETAVDLIEAISIVRRTNPAHDEQALVSSIQDSDPRKGVRPVLERWLRKMPTIPYPALNLPAVIAPLDTPCKLAARGRKGKNCLASIEKIVDVASGRRYFYECEGLVAEVAAIGEERLVLVDIYETGMSASREQLVFIERAFKRVGVPSQYRRIEPGWEAVERLLRRWSSTADNGPIPSGGVLGTLQQSAAAF